MMSILNRFKDEVGALFCRADLACGCGEEVGAGGSPEEVITLPATCRRQRLKVTAPTGSGVVIDPMEDEVFVVEAILSGPRISTADGGAAEAALYASLIADERFPNIDSSASARRAVACTFGALLGTSTIDAENKITIRADT